jgi:hypothetical protein
MFVCTMVQYKFMKLLRNDVHKIFGNMTVQNKIYHDFYHGIVYMINEGLHIIMYDKLKKIM